MSKARTRGAAKTPVEVVDFDAALFAALPAEARTQLLQEAELLARAFGRAGDAVQLEALADQLSGGLRDMEMNRAHARRLAATLRHLAQVGRPD